MTKGADRPHHRSCRQTSSPRQQAEAHLIAQGGDLGPEKADLLEEGGGDASSGVARGQEEEEEEDSPPREAPCGCHLRRPVRRRRPIRRRRPDRRAVLTAEPSADAMTRCVTQRALPCLAAVRRKPTPLSLSHQDSHRPQGYPGTAGAGQRALVRPPSL